MSNFLARVLNLPTEHLGREQNQCHAQTISKASPSENGLSGLTGLRAVIEWPQECLESEKRMGMRYARLFPLLEREVDTPSGRGVLIQVFAERAAVNISGKIIFVLPEKVLPLGTEQIGLDRECSARCQIDSEDYDRKSNDC
jgi:hypothetical protein